VKNLKVAVLGAGSMGTAIIDGLIAKGMNPGNISALTNTAESLQRLQNKYPINVFCLEENTANAMATADDADVIILATKPYLIVDTATELSEPHLKPDALIISVAAGITCATIEASLPLGNPVVRSMPNTPAIVGKAVTGISAGSRADEKHVQLAVELFSSIGKTLVLNESRIDALSTISGSGPAYVFFLIEKFVEAAKHQGFSDDEARLLVNETFLGSVDLLIASGKDPAELRRQVTSPNGTTMQAIARMEEAELGKVFAEATDAALARAREIAAGK
jgi:pyrroline-5-carboxylate reductase